MYIYCVHKFQIENHNSSKVENVLEKTEMRFS